MHAVFRGGLGASSREPEITEICRRPAAKADRRDRAGHGAAKRDKNLRRRGSGILGGSASKLVTAGQKRVEDAGP
jgi:hypothetical protein